MNEMQRQIETDREAEVNRTGAIVRNAREEYQKAESALSENKNKILGYRQIVAQNHLELDTLGDFESLNTELKKRYLDLEESNKSYELFISGAEKEVPTLNHNITMAQARLNTATNNYTDARNAGQDKDGLTSNEREKLSKMSLSMMSFADKKYWSDRVGGIDKLREIVPVI